MFQKLLHFLKYNNLSVFIVLAVFILGSGVFAQTETGQALIGTEQTTVEGTDNTVLLATDLDNFNMDFKIEKIEQDGTYYYVTYTYLDIVTLNNAWQYQINQNVRKISKKLRKDLGRYIAEQLKQEADKRLADLKKAKAEATAAGPEERVEVIEYSGLIGKTLDLASKVFPGYEPVKKTPLPLSPLQIYRAEENASSTPDTVVAADNLTDLYNDYMANHDQDGDKYLDALDNCPAIANPDQKDTDQDGAGDACDSIDDTASSTPSVIEPTPEPDLTASTTPDIGAEPVEVQIIDITQEASSTTP